MENNNKIREIESRIRVEMKGTKQYVCVFPHFFVGAVGTLSKSNGPETEMYKLLLHLNYLAESTLMHTNSTIDIFRSSQMDFKWFGFCVLRFLRVQMGI